MSSCVEIGLPVPSKIYEKKRLLPYMCMTAILVIRPGLFMYILAPFPIDDSYKIGFNWPSGFRKDV